MKPHLSLLLLSGILACGGDADRAGSARRFELSPALTAVGSVLPPEVQSCGSIADQTCIAGTRHVCAVYDPAGGGFTGEPSDLVQRVYHADRYMDLYQRTESSGVGYFTTAYQAPGTPEAEWAAPERFERYVDHGDGAFYMGLYVFAAAHRYAVTGTAADYDRMVALLEKQLLNWRITGVPGYMIRAPFAMLDPDVPVPPGHPEYNLHGHKERTNHVLYTVPEERRHLLPDYYHQGVDIDGRHYATTPTLEGSPSLDAYSGAFLGFQFAYDLLRPADRRLREEIAEAVTCFLKRMRKLRIDRLQESELGRFLIGYLFSTGALHLDPDDIDLTRVDTIVGYVQETLPPEDVGDFPLDCPAHLPTEVDPSYAMDATNPLFIFQLVDLVRKLQGQGPHPIDFVYFVSHRGGDVGYLINYALFAHQVSGDPAYLDFLQDALIDEVDGLAVLNTAGSFFLPPYCNAWIGGDLIHPIFYGTLARLDDDRIAPSHRRALREEFKDKLFANDGNAYFGMTYAASVGSAFDPGVRAYAARAAEELDDYVLDAAYPLDPKRNYSTDHITHPLPGYEPEPPTQAEVNTCEQGLYLGDFEIIPGPGVDPDFAVISRAPLPVELRVPHQLIWHFSPFNLKRDFGDREGRDHMAHIDLTLPYWIGRYHGLIASGRGTALGWQDLGTPCAQ